MKTRSAILFLFLSLVACDSSGADNRDKDLDKAVMAEQVKEAFLHAWRGYEQYAWGHDALKPLSKSHHDWYEHSLLMTPLDAFDTMILMGLDKEAQETKSLVLENLSFDRDMEVQVFEINIRTLGGLLSAYQLDGDGLFLTLARDLADRLLPAFETPTEMPYRFVNLRSGAVRDPLNNPAEIGTLIIELGALSRLTSDTRYYDTAKRAHRAVFERHSAIGLPGTVIDVTSGEWVNRESHISGW